MKTLVAIAAFVAASINANANATTKEKNNSTAVSTSIVNNCVVMCAEKTKAEFALDNMGRATSKTVYNWDEATGAWVPSYQYSVVYGDTVNVLAYAKWDSASRTFSKNFDSMCYSNETHPTLIAVPKR